MRQPTPLGLALTLAYVAFMLSITWMICWTGDGSHAMYNLVPSRTIAHDLARGGRSFWINFVGNIAAFVPIGALAARYWFPAPAIGRAALAGLALSLVIESGQFLLRVRFADIDDLLLNTLGSALGAAMVPRSMRRPVQTQGLDGSCR